MKNIILLCLVSILLSSCGDECSSYSEFSCKEIERAEYNVYFYYPANDSGEASEEYLGKVNGLAYCGSTAWGYANQKSLTRSDKWSYICCMIAKGSSCYEKHR